VERQVQDRDQLSRLAKSDATISVMPNEVAAGFWSYARDDNKSDGGAILELARLIKEEYELLSGDPLELFVDRDSIAWGRSGENALIFL
jgi:hypothetical protein